jgi:hypothetical protein
LAFINVTVTDLTVSKVTFYSDGSKDVTHHSSLLYLLPVLEEQSYVAVDIYAIAQVDAAVTLQVRLILKKYSINILTYRR